MENASDSSDTNVKTFVDHFFFDGGAKMKTDWATVLMILDQHFIIPKDHPILADYSGSTNVSKDEVFEIIESLMKDRKSRYPSNFFTNYK